MGFQSVSKGTAQGQPTPFDTTVLDTVIRYALRQAQDVLRPSGC